MVEFIMGCCFSEKHISLKIATIVLISALQTGCEETPQNITPPPPPFTGTMTTPFVSPPVTNPHFVARTETGLADDERVVGIVLNAGPRAYPIKALSGMQSHVVFGTSDNEACAVTYCDRTDCVRVFREEKPFQIQTGGLVNGEMSLIINGQMYPQSAPAVPISDHPFVVTTLSEWMKTQPSTLIYLRGAFENSK